MDCLQNYDPNQTFTEEETYKHWPFFDRSYSSFFVDRINFSHLCFPNVTLVNDDCDMYRCIIYYYDYVSIFNLFECISNLTRIVSICLLVILGFLGNLWVILTVYVNKNMRRVIVIESKQ